MYKDTLSIEFPDIGDLIQVTLTRHDMVHRNGKTKEGVDIEVSKSIVDDIISKIETFVNEINSKINPPPTTIILD